jgi:anti-sigma factor RsiW
MRKRMLGMRRETARRTTLVVLGLLFLRALVPAGFMLAPVDGTLALVLCDAAATAEAHQHHHHPGHAGTVQLGGMHGDPGCPYALSGGAAPLPTLPVLAGASIPGSIDPFRVCTQTLLRFGPIRRQSPRGPPRLA